MNINFENEKKEIISDLKQAGSYLDSERVIIQNIRKHLANGLPITVIEGYLKKLKQYFEDLVAIVKDNTVCTNYRYAAGFLNTLVTAPYWHSWIARSNL